VPVSQQSSPTTDERWKTPALDVDPYLVVTVASGQRSGLPVLALAAAISNRDHGMMTTEWFENDAAASTYASPIKAWPGISNRMACQS
jgi:hypothetical protein